MGPSPPNHTNDANSDASDTNKHLHRYGPLARSVVIPRPGSAAEPSDVGKIFLEYKDVESAIKAATEIARRQFNQRVIVVNYINEVDWVSESVSESEHSWGIMWCSRWTYIHTVRCSETKKKHNQLYPVDDCACVFEIRRWRMLIYPIEARWACKMHHNHNIMIVDILCHARSKRRPWTIPAKKNCIWVVVDYQLLFERFQSCFYKYVCI